MYPKDRNAEAELCFREAQQYSVEFAFPDHDLEKERQLIRKGLTLDLQASPFFVVHTTSLVPDTVIHLILPKSDVITNAFCLDGASFYSSVWTVLLDLLIARGASHLIYSMNNVSYFADVGLALYTAYVDDLQQRGGTLIISNVNRKILNMLELLKYPDFINITPSILDAIWFIEERLHSNRF